MARLRRVAQIVIGAVVVLLVLVGLGIAAIETGWAKERLRRLIVRQANEYLTASLEIGSLGGSLFRGLELGDVRLSREGRTLIAIDQIALSYSVRELLQPGVVVRREDGETGIVVEAEIPASGLGPFRAYLDSGSATPSADLRVNSDLRTRTPH